MLLESRVTSPLEKLKFLDCLQTDYSLPYAFVDKKNTWSFLCWWVHTRHSASEYLFHVWYKWVCQKPKFNSVLYINPYFM
jgi:hypothetical protein